MIKSSNLDGHFRELMGGENQCVGLSEWTLEPPNRTLNKGVGFGEQSHRYKRRVL